MELIAKRADSLAGRHYLEVLRTISLRAVSGMTPGEHLTNLVEVVATELFWDACSIYILEEEANNLVLAATYGLSPESVGKVHLPIAEGLVGSAVREERPILVEDAQGDPRFKYFPETGEEKYQSLAAVPFSRDGKISGVLTVQTLEPYHYTTADTHFLDILASQIGLAVNAAMSLKALGHRKASLLVGTPAAPGVAEARVHIVSASQNPTDALSREFSGVESEKQLFDHALKNAVAEINAIISQLEGNASPVSQIFTAHKMMLQDPDFSNKIHEAIETENESAPRAVVSLMDEYIAKFKSFENRIMREKAQDIKDLRNTLLRFMDDSTTGSAREDSNEQMVVIATELTPQETIRMDTKKVVAFVTETGTEFSHAVILSRALELPAVVGVAGITEAVKHGDRVLVDGNSGFVFINPDADIKKEYMDKYSFIKERQQSIRDLLSGSDEHPLSLTRQVSVDANIGLPFEIEHAQRENIHSVGLLRTEFFYMSRENWPEEELQIQFYERMLRSFASGTVTIRLLDIGGDKSLSYMPELSDDQSHFGLRSVRLLLDHPEILRSQLKAVHHAAERTECVPQLLVPMVSHAWEMAAVRETLLDVTGGKMYPIGAMIENPAALFQVEEIFSESDFISIGTNDLSQYLLVVDRNDARMTHLYHPLHPALIRAMDYLFQAMIGFSKPFSVCGEMAGESLSVLALLILGYRHFSLSPPRALEIHYLIRQIPEDVLAALHLSILRSGSPQKTEKQLRAVMREYAPLVG